MSGDDEGLGSETRLDRPRSAKGHRKRPIMDPPEEKAKEEEEEKEEEEGGGGGGGEQGVSDGAPMEAHPSTQSLSPPPPPPLTHPPSQPAGIT